MSQQVDNESLQIDVAGRYASVCNINGQDYPILHEFTVLYPGWEHDDDGYVIEYQGQPRLLLSDHGDFDLVSQDLVDYRFSNQPAVTKKPRDQIMLMQKLVELDQWRRDTQHALDLLLNTGSKE